MSRRDLTPTGFRIPGNGDGIDLTAEELGHIMRDAAESLRKAEENSAQLKALNAKVEQLIETSTQGRTLLVAGRWVMGILLLLISGFVSWVYSEQRAHDVRLTRNETQISHQTTALERFESVEETQGQMQGDISAMRVGLVELQRSVAEIRTDVREIRARGRR